MTSRFALVLACFALSSSCGVTVRGSPLSSRPPKGAGVYLSTGSAPGPFRTLGFAQVRAYGVELAGFEAGAAVFDTAIQGELTKAARQLGGNGVINIELVDENPQTPADRVLSFTDDVLDVLSGEEPKPRPRYVTATGEVIQLIERK